MLRHANSLVGYDLKTSSSESGKVVAVFFDEDSWKLRYLVVEGGKWLSYRNVLLSFEALESIDDDNENIFVSVDGKSVIESPDLKTELPISRGAELLLAKYWNWTPYWTKELLPPYINRNISAEAGRESKEATEKRAQKESRLRSVEEVTGYSVHARNGGSGHVASLVYNESDHAIRYILVDTRKWFGGREVLVPIEKIEKVSWSSNEFVLEPPAEQIKSAPEYESLAAVSNEFEQRIREHFGV